MPKHITLALTALLALLLLAAPARAGTYTVYSCKTPSGKWVGSEGWSRDVQAPVQGVDRGSAVLCTASDQKFQLRLGNLLYPVEDGTAVEIAFTAPFATSIASATILRSFAVDWPITEGQFERPYVYDAWHDEDQWERHMGSAGTPAVNDPLDTTLSARNQRWNAIRLRLICWPLFGAYDCGPRPTSVTVERAEFQLSDDRAPWVSTRCCDSVARGKLQIGFSTQDLEGGIYRSRFEFDGRLVAERVVDSNGGRCVDVEPNNNNPYEFATPEPCPSALDGEVEYDTHGLRDGPHTWRLSIEDAAGNRSNVLDQTITTHNAPVSVNSPVLRGAEQVGLALTADPGQWDGEVAEYGYRWLRCDGAGNGCVGVPGAEGAEYRVETADAYHRLVVEVTAGNASGTAVARSEVSGVIADAEGNTSPPAPVRGEEPKPSTGGTGSGGGGTASGAGSGGVAGIPSLQNPLGEQPGRAANGSGASAKVTFTLGLRRAGGGTTRRVLGARGRRWTVAGRLLNASGRPIGGARINLVQRVSGRRWVARKGLVRTQADGRFSATLPGGPSRTVRATYFPFGDSDAFRASNTVAIDVLAPLTIAINRAVVSGRRNVTIRGSAGGGSIPRGGLLVTLQGYQTGYGWRTFRTLRTDSRGRWRTSYRFRATHGRFAFRALVPHQGNYPYATTVSRAVGVTVR